MYCTKHNVAPDAGDIACTCMYKCQMVISYKVDQSSKENWQMLHMQ